MSIARGLALAGAVVAAVVALTAGGSLLPGEARAQVSCDWYARTALEQQRLNLERNCGFEGSSWSTDRSRHLAWCKSTSPDEWKRQAQLRDQQLAKCKAR